MPSIVAASSPRPTRPAWRGARRWWSCRPDLLGDHAEDGPGVELLDDPERAAPVISSPCSTACCTGAAPRQAGSSEKWRLTQPWTGDVERRLRQQRAVGDHRAAVGRDLPQPVEERGVAGLRGLQHLDARLGGELGDRAGMELAAAPRLGVGPGHHGDHLVGRRPAGPAATGARSRECPRRRDAPRWPPAGGVRARTGRRGPTARSTRPRGPPSWRACAARRPSGR